jgi:WD40 repeat protein
MVLRIFDVEFLNANDREATELRLQEIKHHHEAAVTVSTFSQGGEFLVTGSMDWSIKVWHVPSARLVKTLMSRHTDSIWVLEFSPDGTRLVSGGKDHAIHIWDTNSWLHVRGGLPHQSHVMAVAFDDRSEKFASAAADVNIFLWSAENGDILAHLKLHGTTVSTLAFSRDGTKLVTGSEDASARITSIVALNRPGERSEGAQKKLANKLHHPAGVTAVVIPPVDPWCVLTACKDGILRLFRLSDGKRLHEVAAHSSAVRHAEFSPDGVRLITASEDCTAKVWNAASETYAMICQLDHSDAVVTAHFTHAGAQAISLSTDNSIRVWSISSEEAGGAKQLAIYALHSRISGFAVCNGGDLGGCLFCASDISGFTRILDVRNVQPMGRFDADTDKHISLHDMSAHPVERSWRQIGGERVYVGRRLRPTPFDNTLWRDIMLPEDLRNFRKSTPKARWHNWELGLNSRLFWGDDCDSDPPDVSDESGEEEIDPEEVERRAAEARAKIEYVPFQWSRVYRARRFSWVPLAGRTSDKNGSGYESEKRKTTHSFKR